MCIYVRVCVRTYVFLRVRIFEGMYTFLRVCTNVYMYVRIYTCIIPYVRVCTNAIVCLRVRCCVHYMYACLRTLYMEACARV